MIEFYKYLYGLSAPIMKEVFTKRILKYNLRNCRENLLPNPKTKKYGTDTVAYKASQLWSTLPTRYKNLKQQWFIRIKHRNMQWMQHVRVCHAYCFG